MYLWGMELVIAQPKRLHSLNQGRRLLQYVAELWRRRWGYTRLSNAAWPARRTTMRTAFAVMGKSWALGFSAVIEPSGPIWGWAGWSSNQRLSHLVVSRCALTRQEHLSPQIRGRMPSVLPRSERGLCRGT